MGLLVWLPLDGTLENKGVSNITANVQSGVAVDNNGKIGKCYTNSGTSVNVAIPFSFITKQFSLCAWVKINTRRNNWCRAFGLSGSGNYIGLGCEHTNGTGFGFHFYKTINGTNTSVFDTYPLTFSTGTWAHFLMAYDGTKYYIYKDGALIVSANASKTNIEANMNTLYLFGGTANNYSLCSLNDVRIYDHCLSAAEVHEISQGLVLHYKLDSAYDLASSIQNKYNSPYSDGQCSGSNFTRTQLTNERGYNYKATFTGTGTNTWYSWYVPAYSFTAGKRYYYSVKIRCNKWTVGTLTLRAARSSNDYGGCDAVTICSNGLADGQWHEYVVSEIVNETYVRSGSTVTCSPRMEFYTANMNGNGTVYDMDFDVKDVQVVESDSYIPFINNALATSTITDSSGYGHSGTISGNPTLASNSARYSACTYIPLGSTDYITTKDEVGNFSSGITMSIWIKSTYTSPNNNYHNVFNIATATQNYEFSVHSTGYFRCGIKINGSRNVQNTDNTNLLNGNWHMLTMTYDGTIVKRYVDGVLKASSSVTGTPDSTSCKFMIGHYGTNTDYRGTQIYESDARIYCTALSAADVKQLYEVGAKVDNLQNLHTFELNEQSINYLTIDSAWLNSSGTHNNINWSFNSDSSFTLNGTKSTSSASILIWNFASKTSTSNNGNNVIKNLPNGTYIMYTGHAQATLQIYGTNSDGNDPHQIKTANVTPVVFTIDNTYSYNWVRLHIAASAIFNNFTFYPAIYSINDTISLSKNNLTAGQFIESTKTSFQKGNKVTSVNFIEK